MQPRRGLPYHPSLPAVPHAQNPGQFFAQSVASSSAYVQPNHYWNAHAQYAQPQHGVASHYAQAYTQQSWRNTNTTSEGYSLSTTYNPNETASTSTLIRSRPIGQWYQPGSARCSQLGCQFTGSPKSVEIHMMDRHLIYPPGWEKRKNKDDWDADPSLKGKPLPIQGTNIKLDTPEAIEQWIAERKNRFPTADRVADKQRKLSEAIERGQLPIDDPRLPRQKRRRIEETSNSSARGRGRGRGRGTDRGWRGRGGVAGHSNNAKLDLSLPQKPVTFEAPAPVAQAQDGVDSDSSSDSDSDGAPEVVSSKVVPPAPTPQEDVEMNDTTEPAESIEKDDSPGAKLSSQRQHRKLPPRQPRKPSHNPFAVRPSLLRNLLLPEIRMTVSNLSQAIHFLVENDFLDNVELKPGQAENKMIEVIGQTDHTEAPSTDTVPHME